MDPSEPAPTSKRSRGPGPCTEKPDIPVARSTPPLAGTVWTPEPVRGAGDKEIARIAGLQYGYVTRTQLEAAGLTRHAIAHRLHTARLIRRYRGVYAVGRESTDAYGEEAAAILSFAGAAVLSHFSAAVLWGVIERPLPEVTVSVTERRRHSIPGLTVHRTTTLTNRDLRLRHRLPLTSPARTLLDLAATPYPDDELERAIAEARVKGLLRPGELETTVAAAPARRGAPRLTALLDAEHGPALTHSEAERRFLMLVRKANLPAPIVNGRVLSYEVDFHWPAEKLIVETDGRAFHAHPRAFERDRRRDQVLVAAGWRVIRITFRQLETEPLAVIARITMALMTGRQAA